VESQGALEAYLKAAPIQYTRPLPGGGGHQEKKILILEGGVAVAAKPGHDPNYAQQAKCEVGAHRLAVELAMSKLVPTTVLRPVPGPNGEVEGSVQVLWPQFVVAAGSFTHTDCQDKIGWEIAVFDALAANTDATTATGARSQPSLMRSSSTTATASPRARTRRARSTSIVTASRFHQTCSIVWKPSSTTLKRRVCAKFWTDQSLIR
jgi:hypothetical protein